MATLKKAKINTEDTTDDFIVKGVDDKDTETNPKPITYTQDGQDRCLDVRVCNSITGGSPGGAAPIPAWNKNLRYLDMGVSNGGIARATTIVADDIWVYIFSYTGSGLLSGFSSSQATADSKWDVGLEIDGEDIFNGSTGLDHSDIKNVYDLGSTTQNEATTFGNLSVDSNTLKFTASMVHPIAYKTSVKIKIRRNTGDGNKAWNGGLVVLSKET